MEFQLSATTRQSVAHANLNYEDFDRWKKLASIRGSVLFSADSLHIRARIVYAWDCPMAMVVISITNYMANRVVRKSDLDLLFACIATSAKKLTSSPKHRTLSLRITIQYKQLNFFRAILIKYYQNILMSQIAALSSYSQ